MVERDRLGALAALGDPAIDIEMNTILDWGAETWTGLPSILKLLMLIALAPALLVSSWFMQLG